MKKLFCVVFILFVLLITFAGCNSNKETYIVKQVVIDTNGESIILEINKETLKEYSGVSNAINNIGNKIIVKNNEVIFNGDELKNTKSTVAYDDEYDEYYIKFSELPPIVFKGSKIFEKEIYIYVSINRTLSYLIYEKK